MPAVLAMQNLCTADVTGESGARASLAMKDAVAPRAPLRIARLLMDMGKERGITRRIGSDRDRRRCVVVIVRVSGLLL